MSAIDLAKLTKLIETRAAERGRVLVAIAGAPGSGKTTLAADLAAQFGPVAVVLPMDGFHLDNAQLQQMYLLDRKGAPETFDAEGFVALLSILRDKANVSFPKFDRDADKTIPDAGLIDEHARIILIEGNYLLLKDAPWSRLAQVFDLTVRLDVRREELERRLIARWLDHGLPMAEARLRAYGNDMKNADYVIEHSRIPDVILRQEIRKELTELQALPTVPS